MPSRRLKNLIFYFRGSPEVCSNKAVNTPPYFVSLTVDYMAPSGDLKRAAAERSEEKASGRQAARGGYAGSSATEVTKSLPVSQFLQVLVL